MALTTGEKLLGCWGFAGCAMLILLGLGLGVLILLGIFSG